MVVKLSRLKIKRFLKTALAVILGLIGVVALILLFFNIGYADRVFPRVYLGKNSIGGLKEPDLKQRINAIAKAFESQVIVLKVDQETVEIKPEEIGLTMDQNAIVHESITFGRGSHLMNNLADQIILLVNPYNVNRYINFDGAALDSVLAEQLKKFEQAPVDARLKYEENELRVEPAKIGRSVSAKSAYEKIESAIESANLATPIHVTIDDQAPAITTEVLANELPKIQEKIGQPIVLTWNDQVFTYKTADLLDWITLEVVGSRVTVVPKRDSIVKAVEGVAKKINRSAKDARLKLTDGKVEVFQASNSGYELEKNRTIEQILALIKNGGDRSISLIVSEKPPAISTAQVNDLGINELIGKGTTSFAGSPENRKHNIRNGAQILNGLLVAPGGEFSTLASLGQIDDVSGFLPELVIKENRTIPEFGGGLCQVSTTLFRAALNTGLPITERQNHSWRISYYEKGVGPGLDATVYEPKPDFKFRNDTNGWILIQGYVKGDEITFEIYGTKDGRRVVLEGPKTLSTTKPPPPVYVETSDLAQGETKQIEKPHPGGSAIATYIVYNTDGSERNRQVFRSSYKAVSAKYLVGTGQKPAPEPESASQPASQPEQPVETQASPQLTPTPSQPDPTVQATPVATPTPLATPGATPIPSPTS